MTEQPYTPDFTDQPKQNTDRELWREVAGDYYSPSIHVTQDGRIGINVGGLVIVRTLREWHALAVSADLEFRSSRTSECRN